jgi:hypothetical protein
MGLGTFVLLLPQAQNADCGSQQHANVAIFSSAPQNAMLIAQLAHDTELLRPNPQPYQGDSANTSPFSVAVRVRRAYPSDFPGQQKSRLI